MKLKQFVFLLLSIIGGCFCFNVNAESTRAERKLISKGNSLYNERRFVEAQSYYEEALKVNSSSAEARYNLGLSQVRQVTNPSDTTGKNKKLLDSARKNFSDVASLAKTKPGLASKANYNLGNVEFNVKDYAKAIEYYKQALRINPNDDKARKNLRIAQKNLQNQNQDQNNKNQDQDKQDNNDQNQDKQQNQDQNKDQQNQLNKDQKKDEENDMNQQTASQILQAIDNKEAATRARVNKENSGEKAAAGRTNMRKW